MLRTCTLAVMIAASLSMTACSPTNADASSASQQAGTPATAASSATADASHVNPFASKSTLPFQAPPFDKIKDSDYKPAIEKGMAEDLAEVEKIANNPAPPTFQNTYVALQKSGAMLTRVMNVFSAITSADMNPTLQKIQKEMAPKLAAHQDKIYLNEKLFKRLKAVHDKRDELDLDPADKRLVHVVYNNFVHHGANLSEADKVKLADLNQKAATLSTKFTNQLLADNHHGGLVVDNKAALDGLSDDQIAAAAKRAKERGFDGKWVLTLQNTTRNPLLKHLNDRATRKALYMASINRAEKGGENDTRATIKALAKVRAKEAKLLGYPDWAAWKLVNQMAKKPQNVEDFLGKLGPAAVTKAKEEAGDIKAMMKKDGVTGELEPWDWAYYANKVRQAKFDVDPNKVKQYFELDNVLKNGVFYAAHKLYGLSFKERHDIPVYADDVHVYEVTDADGKSIGLFYTDYFTRDGKSGGAWMSDFVGQSKLLNQKPVIFNVANFTKPADGKPALLSWDEVTTVFHEFGHALHGLLSNRKYPSLAGTSTARDFVEFPSQFNEYWASNPEVFKHYAVNYKTGEPMPQALLEKVQKARLFNSGFNMLELIEAADLDMNWHTLKADEIPSNVDKFETASLKKDGVYFAPVPPRYRSTYFLHIWGNGYSAGYYAYLWTQMLADNAHQWFLDHGGLTRENGMRFRKMILSRGNSEDLAKLYKDWLGHEPEIGPMLKYRGLEEN